MPALVFNKEYIDIDMTAVLGKRTERSMTSAVQSGCGWPVPSSRRVPVAVARAEHNAYKEMSLSKLVLSKYT